MYLTYVLTACLPTSTYLTCLRPHLTIRPAPSFNLPGISASLSPTNTTQGRPSILPPSAQSNNTTPPLVASWCSINYRLIAGLRNSLRMYHGARFALSTSCN
jgi:hypothetical protein